MPKVNLYAHMDCEACRAGLCLIIRTSSNDVMSDHNKYQMLVVPNGDNGRKRAKPTFKEKQEMR